MATPTIHTYHCLCNTLLLASTHNLTFLPRRAPPSLDSAIIVPLPPAPQQPISNQSPEPGSDSEDADADDANAPPARTEAPNLSELGNTILLSTALDRRPTMIRRSDGFEKRYLLRCGRCRLVVGYELDEAHYAVSESAAATTMDVDQGQEGDAKKNERTKVIYLLPKGIMSTEAMAAGKKIIEQDVVLGDENGAAVAFWES